MKKIIVLFLLLFLSACSSGDNDTDLRRGDENPDYLEEILNEYDIVEVQMLFLEYSHITSYYLEFNNIQMDIDDDHEVIQIVFGLDSQGSLKTLLIPDKVKNPVVEIPNPFPEYHQFESYIDLFNSDEDYTNITRFSGGDYPFVGVEITNRINDKTVDVIQVDLGTNMMLEVGTYESLSIGTCTVYLVYLSNDTYIFLANSNIGREYGYEILFEITISE